MNNNALIRLTTNKKAAFTNTKIGPHPSLATNLSSIIAAIVIITHIGMNIFYSLIESNLTGSGIRSSKGLPFGILGGLIVYTTRSSLSRIMLLIIPVNLLRRYA